MNNDGNSSQPLRAEVLPLLMAILALMTVEIAQNVGEQPAWQIALKIGVVASTVIALYRGLSRYRNVGFQPGRWGSLGLIAVAVLPVPVEIFQNVFWKTGNPLEILLLAGFRNLACGLAVLSYLRAYHRFSSVISLFLVVFASCITADLFVHGLVVIYALIGLWWLMASYWDSLQGHLTGSATERQFPKTLLLAIPVFFLALLCFVPLAAPQVATALPGFMPTSGGERWSDPSARRGLNDGDAIVPATDQARSFGPVDTDIFMESEQPSLYDVFNEIYGDTPKKNIQQDRSVALPPELMQDAHDRMAEQKKLGKQFSTVRSTRTSTPKKMRDVEGTALFYVGGRVPLHLRLQIYDLFDGVEWFLETPSSRKSGLAMEVVNSQPWVHIDSMHDKLIYRQREPHQLKIINLNTNCIPAPVGLTGVHIDRVDRIDMFGWAQESIVKMERDKLPDLTVIHLQSAAADTSRLQNEPLSKKSKRIQYRQLPQQERQDEIAALARKWTETCPDGWQRIEAIASHLRSEFTLDSDYRADENCQDSVAEFLFESKRGSDYAFASAAAILLRNVGYDARVVSGFYADPQSFDPRLRHTTVMEHDVHFWTEVYVGSNTWMTVEPTPGYEVLLPPPTFWESLSQSVISFVQHLREYIWGYSILLAATLTMCWYRREFYDWMSTAIWRLRVNSQQRSYALRTVMLLKQRALGAGIDHHNATTSSRWLRELSVTTDQIDQRLLQRFCQVIDWAAYAPPYSEMLPEVNVIVVCQMAAKEWTLKRMRSLKKNSSSASFSER